MARASALRNYPVRCLAVANPAIVLAEVFHSALSVAVNPCDMRARNACPLWYLLWGICSGAFAGIRNYRLKTPNEPYILRFNILNYLFHQWFCNAPEPFAREALASK